MISADYNRVVNICSKVRIIRVAKIEECIALVSNTLRLSCHLQCGSSSSCRTTDCADGSIPAKADQEYSGLRNPTVRYIARLVQQSGSRQTWHLGNRGLGKNGYDLACKRAHVRACVIV